MCAPRRRRGRALTGVLVIACVGALLAGFTSVACAHGRSVHPRLDFYFGTPLLWGPPYYRRYPYYDEPQTIIIEREPMVYIQRPPVAGTGQVPVWHYCTDPPGYYPYVQRCTQAWIPVDPKTVLPPAAK